MHTHARNFPTTDQQPTRGVAIDALDATAGRPDGGEESPTAALHRALVQLQNGLYWLDRLDELSRRGAEPSRVLCAD